MSSIYSGIIIVCLLPFLCNAYEINAGEQVWSVRVNSVDDFLRLTDILVEPVAKVERERSHHNHTQIYFRVEKRYIKRLRTKLATNGFDYDIIVRDVLRQLDMEHRSISKRRKRSVSGAKDFDYARYHRIDEIEDWMDSMAANYSFVSKISIGTSYRGRQLYVLKVSANPSDPNRPVLYVDAGIHAREWITPAALMYAVKEIVSNHSYAHLLPALDFYFVPVINLDGYEYTWKKVCSQSRGGSNSISQACIDTLFQIRNRLWRKTRRPYPANNRHCQSGISFGVDGNRNWDVNFGGEGSSNMTCSYLYHGPFPESEDVIRHLAKFLRQEKTRIKGLISLHNYGQQILYPYNYNISKFVGNKLSAAIESVHGRRYESGPGSKVLYVFSGSTSDWAYEKAGIPLSYTIEVRDTGTFRFELPEYEIIPTSEEVMAGIQYISEYIIETYSPDETISSQEPKA